MPSEISGITTTQCNFVLLRAISSLASGHGWQSQQFLKKPWRVVATFVGLLSRKFEIINRLDNECWSPYVADSLKADVSGVSPSWERIAKDHRLKRSSVKSSTMANCNLYKIPPTFWTPPAKSLFLSSASLQLQEYHDPWKYAKLRMLINLMRTRWEVCDYKVI